MTHQYLGVYDKFMSYSLNGTSIVW